VVVLTTVDGDGVAAKIVVVEAIGVAGVAGVAGVIANDVAVAVAVAVKVCV
jgi:hypothetical protein